MRCPRFPPETEFSQKSNQQLLAIRNLHWFVWPVDAKSFRLTALGRDTGRQVLCLADGTEGRPPDGKRVGQADGAFGLVLAVALFFADTVDVVLRFAGCWVAEALVAAFFDPDFGAAS